LGLTADPAALARGEAAIALPIHLAQRIALEVAEIVEREPGIDRQQGK
jgi:hypothetical protein